MLLRSAAPTRLLRIGRIFKHKSQNPVRTGTGLIITLQTDGIMSVVSVPELPEVADHAPTDVPEGIPPLRWIVVGYCFWLGIFFGALIMHSVTAP